MSRFVKNSMVLSIGLLCAGFALAGSQKGEMQVQLFNQHSIKPKVVTDEQCSEGPKSMMFKFGAKSFTAGDTKYSNSKYKLKHLKNGLVLVNGSQKIVVHGKDKKVLYKGKLYYRGVGVKGIRGSYGAYSDGYCVGNYISKIVN